VCELVKAAEEAAQGRQSVSRAWEPRMMRMEDAEDSQDGGGGRAGGWMDASSSTPSRFVTAKV
jgi:hypothetical protein